MLVIFVLLSLLLSFLTDWCVYNIYCRPLPKRRTHCLCWLPTFLTAAISASMFVFAGSLPVLSILLLCVTVPKFVFTLVSLLLILFPMFRRRKALVGVLAGAAGVYLLGVTAYGALEGIRRFDVEEVSVVFKDLPGSFDGYRIVQISDLHCGSWDNALDALSEAVRLVNGQHPDAILFTGDLVNATAGELIGKTDILAGLKARDGVYSVLGNHDYGSYAEWASPEDEAANLDSLKARQTAMGWRLLDNSHVIIRKGEDSIAIAGVQNGGEPPFPDYSDLPQALAGAEGVFTVLMSHDPTHWRREVLPESDVQLTLSGHTHDMQFRVLGFSPASWAYPEHHGLYLEGERALYVNAGLGSLLPIRLGAWPEITVLVLKCGR